MYADVKSGHNPSLKDGHFPGWVVEQEPHLVRMREIGTGRSYLIPTERFNKAAKFLSEELLFNTINKVTKSGIPDTHMAPLCVVRGKPCLSMPKTLLWQF